MIIHMNFLKSGFLLMLLVSTLTACGGKEERRDAYYNKAVQSFEAGDLDKARVDLKNVLQIDPKHAEAYYLLGTVNEVQKEYRSAYVNFSRASEIDPEDLKFQAKLGTFYLLLAGDVEKAKEIVDLILAKDDSHKEGLLLKAGVYLKEKKRAEAINLSKEIYEKYPEYINNILLLASIYNTEKKYDEAIQLLENAEKQHDRNLPLKYQLVGLYARSENIKNLDIEKEDIVKAENILIKIAEIENEAFIHRKNLALFYAKIDKKLKAKQTLLKAIADKPDDIERKITYIAFIKTAYDIDDAITEMKLIIEADKGNGELRMALVQLYGEKKDVQKVMESYTEIISDFDEKAVGIEARTALANIYILQKKIESARKLIDEASAISPNDTDVHYVKAQLFLLDDDFENAITSLRSVIRDQPESINASLMLAAIYRKNDEIEQSKDTLIGVRENIQANPDALLKLAKYYISLKDYKFIEEIIDDILRVDDGNEEALVYKIRILNGKKKYDDAKELADKLTKLYPENIEGYIQATPSMFAEKNYEGAGNILEKGYIATNHNIRILAEIVKLKMMRNDARSAIELIKQEISGGLKNPGLYEMLAKVQASDKQAVEAGKTLESGIEHYPEISGFYEMLSGIQIGNGDFEDAEGVLKRGIGSVKNNTNIKFILASLYEKKKEYSKAIDVYEEIIQENDNSLLAINNLVSLISDHGSEEDMQKALKFAEKIKVNKQPAIQDTLGWLYYRIGNYEESDNILRIVIENSPDVSVFNYHFGMLKYKMGDKTKAKKYLARAVQSSSQFTGKDEAQKFLNTLQ